MLFEIFLVSQQHVGGVAEPLDSFLQDCERCVHASDLRPPLQEPLDPFFKGFPAGSTDTGPGHTQQHPDVVWVSRNELALKGPHEVPEGLIRKAVGRPSPPVIVDDETLSKFKGIVAIADGQWNLKGGVRQPGLLQSCSDVRLDGSHDKRPQRLVLAQRHRELELFEWRRLSEHHLSHRVSRDCDADRVRPRLAQCGRSDG